MEYIVEKENYRKMRTRKRPWMARGMREGPGRRFVRTEQTAKKIRIVAPTTAL
jgi:hypothetical protein